MSDENEITNKLYDKHIEVLIKNRQLIERLKAEKLYQKRKRLPK